MESTVLGDFRLIKRIAKGGMGEVYQAYDTRCRRYVALKKIREDLKNFQGIRKRFLSEAHIAASLTHPAIIAIFTIQAEQDPLYYTMPLLEGQSLKALILQARKDPHLLPLNKAVSIFLAISQGIAHAHSRGFLHRDLKAENLWMGPCDDPVILDWGVAKSVSDVQEEPFSELWGELEGDGEVTSDVTGHETARNSLSDRLIRARRLATAKEVAAPNIRATQGSSSNPSGELAFDSPVLDAIGEVEEPALSKVTVESLASQASENQHLKRIEIKEGSSPRSKGSQPKTVEQPTLESLGLESEFLVPPLYSQHLTRPGKVVGTLSYMAPERALKKDVSYASDIYSLGVLLYFMLTLHLPFRRRSLKEYIRTAKKEVYIDPRTRAPFRDIPKDLVRIVERCLAFEASDRYLTAQDLIDDLELVTQAGSEWVQHAELSPQRDKDWLGKEWVYLTTPVAQSQTLHPESMGWVTRMISRASFEGNLKVRLEIKPKEDVSGLGLLLCAPEQESSHRALDGYCLWIGSVGSTGGQLLRNGVMVLDLPGFCLRSNLTHQLTVECLNNVLHCYFDHAPKVTYVSYLPLIGSHVGLVVAKGHFDFLRVHVFGGKHSLQVSCLAVPDAFLAQKMYRQALSEYRRIGQGFFDYLEGRQAIFRAGITLIEWARQRPDKASGSELLELASFEFEKLKGTLSAPLEWLGKSLVYRELGDGFEEMNALELACRRFENHHLVNWLHEEVVFRLQEHTSGALNLSCRIVLLIVRALPQFMQRRDVHSRVRHIRSQLPMTGFWQCAENRDIYGTSAGSATVEGVEVRMGYFLNDERAILDVSERFLKANRLAQTTQARLLQNAIYSLLFMDQLEKATDLFRLSEHYLELPINRDLLRSAIRGYWPGLKQQHFALSHSEQRLLGWLLELSSRSLMKGESTEGYFNQEVQKEGYEASEYGYEPYRDLPDLIEAFLNVPLEAEQAQFWLPQLGWVLAALRLQKTSDLSSEKLKAWRERWLEALRRAGLLQWPETIFVKACHTILDGDRQEGFAKLIPLKSLEATHPLALLEAWIHRRLPTLQTWQAAALFCEKERLLRYGWLLLHVIHPHEQANLLFEKLKEGHPYAATDPS